MVNKHIFAYLAGYTDGDGCFSIGRHKKRNGFYKYSCSFIISSTDKNILEYFSNFFSGTVRKSSDKITNHKTQFHFYASGKKAKIIAETLYPFLIEKKEECKIFLEYFNNIFSRDNIKDELDRIKNNKNLITKEIVNKIKNSNLTFIPCEQDFCYFAGFIDAECCLGISKYRSKDRENFLYKIYLHCNNTKFPVIAWLKERFGGHIRFVDRNSKNFNHRDQISWRISSKNLSQILSKIQIHLRFKKKVCDELIKFTKLILNNGGPRHTSEFRNLYASNLIEREKICQTVHFLNQKGV